MKSEKPLTIILFGATGDLFLHKILPALRKLYSAGVIPRNVRFIAYGRRSFNDAGFQSFLRPYFKDQHFLELFSYVSGEIDDGLGYHELAERIPPQSNVLIYAALPPEMAEKAVLGLRESKISLRNRRSGFVRIMIEKPFGNTLKGAETLEKALRKSFTQNEIFRIDHYLGKQMLETIPQFRKKNREIEKRWSGKYISSITISLLEKADVRTRGSLYDQVGAFRDVGQNHLLQMLKVTAGNLGKNPGPILEKLALRKGETVRAQYEGYLHEPGVQTESETETYFSVPARIDLAKWKGVSIRLESGKALGDSIVQIKIDFKDESTLTFQVQPEEKIELRNAASKIERFDPREYLPKSDFKEPYEKLFADGVYGKQNRFVSFKETKAEWKFAEKVLRTFPSTLLTEYKKGYTPQVIGNTI